MSNGTNIRTDFDILRGNLQRTNGAIRERTRAQQCQIALNIYLYNISYNNFISGCLSIGIHGLENNGDLLIFFSHMKIC